MPRDERLDIPALHPLLAYVAGLALTPLLVDARAALCGIAAVAVLLAMMRRPRAALAAALFAVAVAVTVHGNARRSDEDAALRSVDPDRFARVEIPLARGWRRNSDESSTLIAANFVIAGDRTLKVEKTLVASAHFSPPPVGTESRMVAEGFLRCAARACYLSLKSPRLLRYEGTTLWWTPAGANRRMNLALEAIAARHPERRRAVMLAQALALGRSDQLPHDVREDYRRGGIYHLLVFSGMQIGLAALVVSAAFRKLHAPAAGDWALLALSIFAPFFAGNEPSVSRAAWMIGLYSLSRLLRRPTSSANLLFVSALIRLVAHPDELIDPGFALTYAAAGGLLLIGSAFGSFVPAGSDGRRSLLRSALRALLYGVGAELATLPLTLFFFHQYVLAGSLVTLVASPLLAAMLACAALACAIAPFSPAAAIPFLYPIAHLDAICTALAAFVGEDLGLAGMAAAPGAAWLCASFCVLLLSQPWLRSRGRAAASLVLVAPVIVAARMTFGSPIEAPVIEILDVGQGDSILMRTPEGAMLVDGGGRSDDPRWARKFLPLLLDRGVTTIDVAALSHPDPDHCTGLVAAIEHLRVRELWIRSDHFDSPCGREVAARAVKSKTTILVADRIRSARRIGLDLDVISPRLRFKRARWNNGSLVLRAKIGGRHLLLTGDIENEAERLHAEESPGLLHADLLKVPHHGSRSSTTAALFDSVKPRVALISCGRRNRFGHPAPEVLERLSQAPVIARTDRNGTIAVRFQERAVILSREFDTPPGGF